MKIKCNLTDEVVYNYKNYLQTKHWQLIKKIKFNYFVHECAVCQKRVGLELHHKIYDNIGNENLDDLVYLCRDCHQKSHNENLDLNKYYDRLKGYKKRKEREAKKEYESKPKLDIKKSFDKHIKSLKIPYKKLNKNQYRCKRVDYWVSSNTWYDLDTKTKGKGIKSYTDHLFNKW